MLPKLAIAAAALFFLATPSFAQATMWWEQQGWTTDFDRTEVDLGEIVDVIGPDDIPSIDDPEFMAADEETSIPGNEPVVALEHNGTARAYPVRYLMWHEIVNDTIAGLPVAVTYCPLCNTSIVFERVVGGDPVTFGTTGKLRHSDLIMYDRTSQTWWQQFTGRAIVGEHAGEKLNALPSFLISFDQFLERYPGGEVLLPDARRSSQSGINPYQGYDTARAPFLFRGDLPEDIEAMARVALVQGEEPVAVALSFLRDNAPYKIGDLEFRWEAGQASALDAGVISEGRDVGSIEVVRIENGEAEPVVYEVTFAFAARAFLPELEIIQ